MSDEQFSFNAQWRSSIIWEPLSMDDSLPCDVLYPVWKPVPLTSYLAAYSTMAPNLEGSIYAEVTA